MTCNNMPCEYTRKNYVEDLYRYEVPLKGQDEQTPMIAPIWKDGDLDQEGDCNLQCKIKESQFNIFHYKSFLVWFSKYVKKILLWKCAIKDE